MISDYLKSIIYGGTDGVLTVASIITGSLGGNYSMGILLIITISNLFSDAISMGLGDFFSTHTVN